MKGVKMDEAVERAEQIKWWNVLGELALGGMWGSC
jgi:hypothetical protein